MLTVALSFIISEIKRGIGRKSHLFLYTRNRRPYWGVCVGILP